MIILRMHFSVLIKIILFVTLVTQNKNPNETLTRASSALRDPGKPSGSHSPYPKVLVVVGYQILRRNITYIAISGCPNMGN